MDACITIFGSCFRVEACVPFNLKFVRSRLSDFILILMFFVFFVLFCLVFLEIFLFSFFLDVKCRHGLMRCRSEISIAYVCVLFFWSRCEA